MGAVQGFKVRVKIGGVNFRCSKASWRKERAKFEVPDSEGTTGGGIAGEAQDGVAHVLGRAVTTITIEQVTYDPDSNPFDNSVIDFTDVDASHSVEIIPDKSDETVSFGASNVRFNVAGCAADVAGLQPCTLEGVVDGDCTLPGGDDH